MNNLYNNGNFDLFKYQLEDEQKILIFYILKNFPQEIKDQICEAIDLATDKYLSEIDYYDWHVAARSENLEEACDALHLCGYEVYGADNE